MRTEWMRKAFEAMSLMDSHASAIQRLAWKHGEVSMSRRDIALAVDDHADRLKELARTLTECASHLEGSS